jgi:hypothetical protein
MKISTILISILIITFHNTSLAEITNYTAKGNLESKVNLPCLKYDDIKNSYTPADLYPSAAKCILENNNEQAVYIFYTASVYAVYDSMRIKDKTAAQARQVLILKHIKPIPDEQKKGFADEIRKIKFDRTLLCNKIIKLGLPDYHPSYMIHHGIQAFSGIKGDGLIEGYDAQKNWQKALSALKCSI